MPSADSGSRRTIELYGASSHVWPSVERTRKFYLRALAGFTLRYAEQATPGPADALLQFAGGACWKFDPHPDASIVIAMHGGPILSHATIRQGLPSLTTSDVLLVNARSDMRILSRMWKGDGPLLRQVSLPVDTSIFSPRDKTEARELLPIPSTDYVLGFVGRLLPQKNVHQFLRMFAEVKRRIAPRTVCAVVIGNYWIDYPVLGYVTAEYPKIVADLLDTLGIADDVVYLPAGLSDDDLASAYNAMDVLVHPTNSIDENFGYVPVEAMACGIPVVGAAYGGLKDTVVDGQTGFLMDTWVTDSGIRMDLARGLAAITTLLGDEELRGEFGAQGIKRISALYSEEACSQALRRAVDDGIDARGRGARHPVVTTPTPAPRSGAALLPALANEPWEYFRDAVADYTSGPPPPAEESVSIQVAGPLEPVYGGWQLLDPAWPARFAATNEEHLVIDHLLSGGTLQSLRAERLASHRTLNALIQSGLLVASRRTESSS